MPEVNVITIIAGTIACIISGFLWFGPATLLPNLVAPHGEEHGDAPGGGLNLGIVHPQRVAVCCAD